MPLWIVGGEGAIGRRFYGMHPKEPIVSLDRLRVGDHPRFQKLDLEDEEECRALSLKTTGPIKVLFLAGKVKVPQSPIEVESLYQSNALSVVRFLNCFSKNIQHFVYVSSISIYGTNHLGEITEETRPLPQSHYALSKLAGEMAVIEAARLSKFNFKIVRLAQVFGVETAKDTLPHVLLSKLLKRERFVLNVHPQTARDYIHVDDVVDILSGLLLSKEEGIFNLGAGRPIYLGELLQKVQKALGLDYEFQYTRESQPFSQVLNSKRIFFASKKTPVRDLVGWLKEQLSKPDSLNF